MVQGQEVTFAREGHGGEGSFCVAFGDLMKALQWCMEVQRQLLRVPWPESILQHPASREERQANSGNT